MIRTNNKVVLYARFSSDNQRTESIDAQLRAMHAYCKQNQLVIVDTYVDEARSATTDRRPAFQQMISDSAKHTFNIVLVHKLDRFARNRYDSAVYKRELKKNGVQVYSVLENLDNSPESIMMEAVLEGMAEYYSQNLGREVMKGMRENALKCKHTGGRPPLGYDVDPETKKLVINEHEAETVRIIFDLYSKGYGYTDIINRLNDEGRRTKLGALFKKTSLSSILTNPKYRGTYVFNKSSARSVWGTRNTHLYKPTEEIIAIDRGCPQIVDAETYKAVQSKIDQHKSGKGVYHSKYGYLLTGKVRCMHCGRSMTGNAARNAKYDNIYITYRCTTNAKYCDGRDISRDNLERYVIELLEKEIFSVPVIARLKKRIESKRKAKQKGAQERCKELMDALQENEKALANIANAVADGLISDALTEKMSLLEAEKAHILKELSEYDKINELDLLAIDGKTICSKYRKLKKTPQSPEYIDFLQSFIDKIIVGRFDIEITLKTGLGIDPTLDTVYSVKRQELYEKKKTE